MKEGFYTIIIFNKLEGNPKKIRISKTLFKSLLYTSILGSITFLCITIFLSTQYIKLNSIVTELESLREKASFQKIKIETFSKKLRLFEAKFFYLENFNKKLQAITLPDTKADSSQNFWSMGGSPNESIPKTDTNIARNSTSPLFANLNDKIEWLDIQLTKQIKISHEIDNYIKENASLLAATPSIWPTKGWLSSPFGYRKSPFTGLREMHPGIDIATQTGASVVATADGIVKNIVTDYGYGKTIEIAHGYGMVTKYSHNSRILVIQGEKVKRGQLIAEVGNTGKSTGPHLHYEIIVDGLPVNPLTYILENT